MLARNRDPANSVPCRVRPHPGVWGLGAHRLLRLTRLLRPRYAFATAAVVRARYSFSAEHSWEGSAISIREEQSRAAVAPAVAKHASRVRLAHARFQDCVGTAWRSLTDKFLLRPRVRSVCGAACSRSSARRSGKHWMGRPPLMLCLWNQRRCTSTPTSSAPTLARPRRCSDLAPDDETSSRRPHQ